MKNINENIAGEMEVYEDAYEIYLMRKDLSGDVLASAKLVKAAMDGNWDEVRELLAAGADPRICRHATPDGMVESALYYALAEKKYKLAVELYEAGDRLDDLICDDHAVLPCQILEFLSLEMHCGRNYFYDGSRTLSECCRCSIFSQIEKLMPSAGQEELNKAFENTVDAWFRYCFNADVYCKILQDLLDRGAVIAEEVRAGILKRIDMRFGKCPPAMSPGKEVLDKITALVKKA